MKLNIYSDPGHAWCKVPRSLLVKYNIEGDITSFSYQRGDYVYLEEDCDLPLLVTTLRAWGKTVEFKELHTNKSSKIRSYSHYIRPRTSLPFKNGMDYMRN